MADDCCAFVERTPARRWAGLLGSLLLLYRNSLTVARSKASDASRACFFFSLCTRELCLLAPSLCSTTSPHLCAYHIVGGA